MENKPPIESLICCNYPVSALFFADVSGYAAKKLGRTKATVSIAQAEAIRRTIALLEKLVSGEVEVDNNGK